MILGIERVIVGKLSSGQLGCTDKGGSKNERGSITPTHPLRFTNVDRLRRDFDWRVALHHMGIG